MTIKKWLIYKLGGIMPEDQLQQPIPTFDEFMTYALTKNVIRYKKGTKFKLKKITICKGECMKLKIK